MILYYQKNDLIYKIAKKCDQPPLLIPLRSLCSLRLKKIIFIIISEFDDQKNVLIANPTSGKFNVNINNC